MSTTTVITANGGRPETPKVKVKSKSHRLRLQGPQAPQWPSYTGSSQFIGTSNMGVTVYVDPTLGQDGVQNAQGLLNDADRVVQGNNTIFGINGGPVNVIVFALDNVTDGTGGADHGGCDFNVGQNIEVCATFTAANNPQGRISALFEAELSECAMKGQLCGFSTGEALSRWCSAKISNNALADFATGPTWAQDGMPNFVDQTDPTDQSADSTGCGMVFLSWLMATFNKNLTDVAPAMVNLGDAGTLAQLYAQLTGQPQANAFAQFMQAVQALPGGVNGDDPFNALPNA